MEFELRPEELDYQERAAREEKRIKENPNLTLGVLIEKLAFKYPDRKALSFGENSWTWSSLNDECNKIANFFRKLNIKNSDTISIMMENCPEYLFLTGGINKIQGVSALINVHQRKQALVHAFNLSNPEWIVVDSDNLPFLLEIKEDLPLGHDRIFVCHTEGSTKEGLRNLNKELEGLSCENPISTLNGNIREIALNIFTSGTTGLPKAVTLSNFKFLHVSIFGALTLKLDINDTIYIPQPLYHGLGLMVGWGGAVWRGASIALRKRFSASNFWQDIKKYNAKCTLYIGEIPRYLLNRPTSEFVKDSPLRKMVGLGLKKDVWERFSSRFNVPHIVEYFGLTESGGFVNVSGKPGMVGRNVFPGIHIVKVDKDTNVVLRNEHGHCILSEPGEIGIALVRVIPEDDFTGYKSKEATEKKLVYNVIEEGDVYFNTGDILKLHKDRWVSFVERSGDTFRWKGENVSTSEVESIISSFPNIRSAVVYGVEIPGSEGKAGMAALTLYNSMSFNLKEFSKFLVSSLPGYAIPIFLRIRQNLEVTGTFKLRKVTLKEEGFNPDKISDPMLIWDPKSKSLEELTLNVYNDIKNGNLVF
ncbi:MAG: AMP-binding protein [Promethearchaeota archaeon]|jgi:acyl-CoA synthetase (AMP-forming)/AMP-acid ligase II